MATTKNRAKKKTASKGTSGSEVQVKTGSAAPASGSGTRLAPWEDLDRLFDAFMRRSWLSPGRWDLLGLPELFESRGPSVDIVDRDDELLVRAEVPGLKKEDLDVSIMDRTLTIKGSTREEKKTEKEDYYRREIRSGGFTRTLLLPAEVDATKAQASYHDGIVELTLPKVTSSKRQRISVS